MGEAPRVRYGEGVLRVPAERRPRHDRHPVGGVVQLCRSGVALAATGLEDAVSGGMPGEETRVDRDRGNRSRRPEAVSAQSCPGSRRRLVSLWGSRTRSTVLTWASMKPARIG